MDMTHSKKLVTSVAAAALLFGLAACENDDADAPDNGGEAVEQTENGDAPAEGAEPGDDPQQPEMPEPELEDVPDVVAEVNGEAIGGDEYSTAYEQQFTEMAMQAQMSGQSVDEEALQEQILDSLIGVELLTQDAEASGYAASEEDVEDELQALAERNGLESVDEVIDLAEEQDISEDELRDEVAQEAMINQLIEDQDVEEPSEEEIEEAYEQQVAQQEAMQEMEGEDGEDVEVPSLEELRPQIEEQLATQKENEAILAHIDDLREDADVEVHI